MPTHVIKRPTLLSRWTFRYVITLFLGLLIIAITAMLWIRQDTIHERKQALQTFANVAAEHVSDGNGSIIIPGSFYEWIDLTQRRYEIPGQFALVVFDRSSHTIFTKEAPPGMIGNDYMNPPELNDQPQSARIQDTYILTTPIMDSTSQIGAIVIAYSYHELAHVNQNYRLIASLLIAAGLLGWIIIYLLSRNLRKPINQLAAALNRMENGDYKATVPARVKEKEIYELLVSFQKMAARLGTLEELRTELLAGVTHELKTPVASIHGLILAVRDQVVTGEEADEFLDISLVQTRRLQHMVTDLLDFNAFASGSMNVAQESLDLSKLLSEIIYQWGLLDLEEDLQVLRDIPSESYKSIGDASRIQQIMVNLLNNSRQALQGRGTIHISLSPFTNDTYQIIVRDDGPGIPVSEQPNIFERYYRGEGKKLSDRGLGLGLTYSRMVAAAMKGQLHLISSTPQGTVFQLLLPKQP
ncbi:HAMP domain-containing sensor histidine kinase [Paenibacillus sinopodophylli]|uniref:HAMP domain-containing sensor histidine kinase n=1 Tax=Paenibacillus sinopodophylli TaxID=1837342 RepID=UPI0014872187|nr:HAMP domain-containing sensor histidine kinase [Paenibacillus sinopodophylli]